MLSSISFSVVDVENLSVDPSSGINYYTLEKACVVLMAPQTTDSPRTVGFNLATYSLLALGAKGE